MPPELKDRLHNAASINGRSLNMEIIQRLLDSLESKGKPLIESGVRQERAEYGPPLNDLEKSILAVFRRLPPEKQLALISLFK